MELEQRVKMLEQEVEVLKHQLQTTLLDIQELLLTNAYPSLRSEDNGSGQARPTPRQVSQTGEEPADQAAPVIKRVSLEAAQDDGEEEPSYPEVVETTRKVTTKKAVRAPLPVSDESPDEENDNVPARPMASRNGRKPQPTAEDEDLDYTPPQKVATKKAVRASLPASDEPPAEEGEDMPVRPTASRNGRRSHVEDEPQDYAPAVVHKIIAETPKAQSEINLDEWVRNKIEQVGVRHTLELIQRYAEENRITPEIREEMLHIVGTSRRNGAQTAPTVIPTDKVEAQPGEEDSQKLILKLIAGVQNAGAGIGRRKKRG